MAAELYDEEFVRDLKIGESIMRQIHNKEDKEVIKRWMSRVCKLKSSDLKVKKARNEFYKYLLQMMRNCLEHERELDAIKGTKKQTSFKSSWSPDRRTYVAIQPLPNQGALIYMACNARPDLGWDTPKRRK